MMPSGRAAVQSVTLAPHEKKTLTISGEGEVRLGLLVREALEMKRLKDRDGEGSGEVFLTQVSSKEYVGTYYSASLLFALSDGTEFEIENRSPVVSDVLVYWETKQ